MGREHRNAELDVASLRREIRGQKMLCRHKRVKAMQKREGRNLGRKGAFLGMEERQRSGGQCLLRASS